MARYEMQQQNWTEEKWQSFAYKEKKSDEKNYTHYVGGNR
jgi:ATP:cob(I)alamin adenosyltransferase